VPPPTPHAARSRARTAAIPERVLVAGGPWGARVSAARVTAALDRGLRAGGLPASDLCPLQVRDGQPADTRALLDALDFDARMRRARAVLLAAARLAADELVGSVAFEVATRARQGGVPAYAVARHSALNAFDVRLLDLQEIVLARGERTLTAAGHRLAAII